MALTVTGASQSVYSASTSVSSANAVREQEAASEKSKFDMLKRAFPGVNFITSRDPLANSNAKVSSKDTVYLDAEALRKLENSPKYAAYLFSEIETSLTYAKGYTLRDGPRVIKKQPGAMTMSFYGRTETSAGASSSASFSFVSSSKSTTPTVFSMILSSNTNSGDSISGTYNSFHQLSNAVCRTRNETNKKWADKFGLEDGEGYYVDSSEVWKNARKALKKA